MNIGSFYKIMKYLMWLSAALSLLFIFIKFKSGEKGPAKMLDAASIEQYSIYIYPFSAMAESNYTPEILKHSFVRMVVISRDIADGCVRDLKKISDDTLGDYVNRNTDIRILFVSPEVELGFEPDGVYGTHNGKSVKHSDQIRNWYLKHLISMKIIED